MGCGAGSRAEKESRDQLFFRELYGYKSNYDSTKGFIHIKTKKDKLDSYTLINPNFPKFYEEKMDYAKEKTAVRPWLTNIVPPDHEIEENQEIPHYSLKIDHVFGYRNDDSRQNLYFLSKDEIIYVTGSLGIIQNIDDLSQKVFGGIHMEGKQVCHTNDIMCLALYRGEISMVATGQRSLKPIILIWSPDNPNVIYAKFHQSLGSKEVSSIAFDSRGQYIGSFGKDEDNSFYIFHLQSKSLYWKESTGKDNALLDLKFNPLLNECCICGNRKVIFCDIDNKKKYPVECNEDNDPQFTDELFTTISYIDNERCVIGGSTGYIYAFKNRKEYKRISLSKGSIFQIVFSKRFQKIYVSDSIKNLFILRGQSQRRYSELKTIKLDSIANSIDVNEEGDMLLGLKTGEIKLIHFSEKEQSEKILVCSHSNGEVRGLVFINDKQAITTGEDNKIILWNLRTHQCESIGKLSSGGNNGIGNSFLYRIKTKSLFGLHQKSWAVSYNRQKGHIAIGLCNGYVSIRHSIKKLDVVVVPNIKIGQTLVNPNSKEGESEEDNINSDNYDFFSKAIIEVKYTNYGDLLAVATKNGILSVIDVNAGYTIKKEIQMKSYITCLDWDQSNTFIQVVTADNSYMFIEYMTGKIKNPVELKHIDWSNLTCKFGYTVQGIFMGLTDPDFITCVCKANKKNIICSGDDHMNINLYNYPSISENPKVKSYSGHSENVVRICFSPDDSKMITIAGKDQSVILWNVNHD